MGMFIKISKVNNYQYVQLVRSYRENNTTKHEVLFNFGRLDEIQNNPSMQRLALRLTELSGLSRQSPPSLTDMSEAQMFNWGWFVYRRLWQKFGLDGILSSIQKAGKTQFDLSSACLLMVLQHLLNPASKLRSYQQQVRYAGLPNVKLHNLYRTLDILCSHKELLETRMFEANRSLFNMQVDVVFYDVTTFSFESVKADSLRDFGFSKDCKFKEVQVVLGMFIDCEGRPVGYELFPGNTFDGKTMEKALAVIEKRFGIHRVIIVADRGLNSKLNLKRITDKGYGYIVASRLKNMGQKVHDEIFSPQGYQELDNQEEDTQIRYKIIDYTNTFRLEDGSICTLPEKLIITYSSKRAKKDNADRNRLIEKAQKMLENKALIKASSKRGGKKYLREVTDNETEWVLDSEAVARDEKFDGYYGIQTSETMLSAGQVLDAYHTLWKIEESFRIMKSTLEVRPIFHWTEERIKGHFVICFLAFLLERTLEIHLKQARVEASPESIREALNSLQLAQIELEEKKYFIKTKGTELSTKVLRTLKIQPPRNVTPVEKLLLET